MTTYWPGKYEGPFTVRTRARNNPWQTTTFQLWHDILSTLCRMRPEPDRYVVRNQQGTVVASLGSEQELQEEAKTFINPHI